MTQIGRRTALFLLLVSPAVPQSIVAPSFGFTPAAQPAGLPASYAAIADFNGDGKPDIVAITAFDTVSVVLGDGVGNFSQPIKTAGLRGAASLSAADVNGDGRMDLIVLNQNLPGSSGKSLSILLGNGDGSFSQVANYPHSAVFGVPFVNPVLIADFDADGKPDLAFINPLLRGIDVMLGNGDGTFRSPVSNYTESSQVEVLPILAGDFNGDGKLDLITIGMGGIILLTGQGDGTFASPVSIPITSGARATECCGLLAGDFNGDDVLDFAVAILPDSTIGATFPNGGVGVYIGHGDGSFEAPAFYASASSVNNDGPYELTAADMTANGNLDLVARFDRYIEVFAGNGDGTFQNPAVYSLNGDDVLRGLDTSTIQVPPVSTSFALGDLNGDGRIDAVLAMFSASSPISLVVLNGTAAPFLRAEITHGDVMAVQTGETLTANPFFNIQVSNASGASGTIGTVTVVASIPTVTASIPELVVEAATMSGDGWNCNLGYNSCSRNDTLEPGSSYPSIRADLAVFLGVYSPAIPAPLTISATISGGGSSLTRASDTVRVLPIPTPMCTYAFYTGGFQIEPAGSSFSLPITTQPGCTWEVSVGVRSSNGAVVPPTDQWIVLTSESTGSGSATVTFSIAPNSSMTSRVALISVNTKPSPFGGLVTIVQPHSGCTYSLSASSASVAAAGVSAIPGPTITTANDCLWGGGSDSPWLTVFVGLGTPGIGTGKAIAYYSASPNMSGAERTGTLNLAGMPFTVTQAASSN